MKKSKKLIDHGTFSKPIKQLEKIASEFGDKDLYFILKKYYASKKGTAYLPKFEI